MNFLAKTLNSLTGQLIPYNKGDFVLKVENIWDLYDGTAKSDNSLVSIFQFEKEFASNYKFALNGARKQSIIKFPGVVKVIEVIENDSTLYMVTERVKPWKHTVRSHDTDLLGIYNISKLLKFVNQDAQTVHGKVNAESVFVTQSGEWKLGGFEIATNLNDLDKNLLLQGGALMTFNSYMHPPEVSAKIDILVRGKSGLKFDAFKFGCFILQVYNDTAITDLSQVNDFLKKVPRSLQAGVKKLLSDSITTRASIDTFVRKGEESFFQNDIIQNFNDLQELDFKNTEIEKLEIIEKLMQNLKYYPQGFAQYKLLPLMLQFYQLNEQQLDLISKILFQILTIEEFIKLDQQNFDKLIKPIIFACFTKPDRLIRMILLTSLPNYIQKLDKNEINNSIFTNFITGFNDTNLAIREETLKSVIIIAEYLTERQLNNELLRHLLKLQNDQSETIRTNVVICLSKIAHLMNKNSRLAILITAFNKSIKDPFLPTRLSTLVAFGSCIDLFTPEIIASRVLSSILPSLLDKSYKIRQEASKIFQLLLEIIHKELAKLPNEHDADEDSKDVTNLGNKLLDTTLGWGNLNRFATPPIEAKPVVAQQQREVDEYEFKDDDEELIQDMDDGWGIEDDEDEDEDEEWTKSAAPTPARLFGATTKPAVTRPKLTPKPTPKLNTNHKSGGLKLQSKPKTSKLKLDLKLDQDESSWGDGWD